MMTSLKRAKLASELFTRFEGNPILTAADWPYPINSVFNPGAVHVNGDILLLNRVEDMRGFSHFCVARSKNGLRSSCPRGPMAGGFRGITPPEAF